MSKVNDVVEARRKGFDAWYAKNRGTLGCGTYKEDLELWNAALDSVCVELPVLSCAMFVTSRDCAAAREGMDVARLAIERAGLKVKP